MAADCPTCGDSFKNKHGVRIHHSQAHDESIAGEPVTCDWCGTTFYVTPAIVDERRFCSQDCMGEWRSENIHGEAHPNWGGETETCEWCDDEFHVRPFNTTARFCSRECKGKWRSENWVRERNGNWKGGQSAYRATRDLHSPEPWNRWRKTVRGDTCEMCGVSASEVDRALEVHHIIPLLAGGTSGEWNLMTLCPQCHKKVESYTNQFTDSIVSV